MERSRIKSALSALERKNYNFFLLVDGGVSREANRASLIKISLMKSLRNSF